MELRAFPPTVHWRGPERSHIDSWRDGMATAPHHGLNSTRPSTFSGSTPACVVSEPSLLAQLYTLCSIAIKAKGEASDGNLMTQSSWESAQGSTTWGFIPSPFFRANYVLTVLQTTGEQKKAWIQTNTDTASCSHLKRKTLTQMFRWTLL